MVQAGLSVSQQHNFAEFQRVLSSAQLLVPQGGSGSNQVFTGFAESQKITDITFDSRKVQQGTLFICKGAGFKEAYLHAAIESGAVGYLAEKPYDVEIPGFIVSDIRKAMAVAARHFFDYPDQKLHLIGVTATKGKSTTVYMIKAVFDAALVSAGGEPCGMLSGIEIFDGVQRREAHLTTDESVELIRNLARCVENGLTHCVVEVSSQALKYGRVAGIEFDTCSFTNIGYDHISPQEHPDFADYFNAKLRIIEQTKDFIYSAAMEHVSEVIAKSESEKIRAHAISFSGVDSADFIVTDVSDDAAGSHFKVNGFEYTIAMPGLFNIENAAAAIACGLLAGFAPEQIALGLRDVRVPGRSELISTADEKIHFFVDYAHNMLSFEKALEALRKLYRGAKIVTLFGAPGNKAYNRRRDLPEVAARFSDEIYVVPEDTDTEDPAEISREIAQYIPDNIPCTIFADRESGINAAFEKAVSDLQSGSTVEYVFFAAGKGREAFLKLNGGYLPYIGDYEVVKKLIARYDTETAV